MKKTLEEKRKGTEWRWDCKECAQGGWVTIPGNASGERVFKDPLKAHALVSPGCEPDLTVKAGGNLALVKEGLTL